MEITDLGSRHLQNVLDSATLVSIISTDPDGVITVFNPGAERMLGYKADELVGKFTPALIHYGPEVVARGAVLSQEFGRPIEGFEVFVTKALVDGYEEREWTYIRKDGEHIQVNLGVTAMHDEAGAVIGFLGIATDITERKKAEAVLAERNRELDFQKHAMDEHSIVSITDGEGNITYANDRFCEISGYTRDELLGQNHRLLKSGFHSEEFYKDIWDTISSGKVWHGEIKNKNIHGGHYWVQATLVPFLDEEGRPFKYIAIRTDITDRKRAEIERAKSEERYHFFLDNVAEGVVLTQDGRIADASDSWLDIFGAKKSDVIGMSPLDLVVPEEKEQVRSIIGAKQSEPYEATLKRFDGTTFHALLRGRDLVRGGQNIRIATVLDISRHKEAEKNLRKAKSEADKANNAKSEFLSSMSHELRTPMNAILGFSQMLEYNQDEPLTETQKTCVEEIQKGGQHLLQLINEILDLTKIEAGKIEISIEDIDMGAVLKECISLVQGMANDRQVSIHVGPGFDAPRLVKADHTRFKQSLLNLMTNAIKYNSDPGRVKIDCDIVEGGMLRTIVQDTGKGIPQEDLPELFEPFSRLRAEHSKIEGTGIGLTITKQLIEKMGGRIGLESECGVGSRFWIDLPMAEGTAHKKRLNTDVVGSQGRAAANSLQGTILYVEDNPANMQLMELIIRRMTGLTLLKARNAIEGLDLVVSHRPNLVIMDINLPGMDGFAALKKIQELDFAEETPVIALSANAMSRDINQGLKAGFKKYLAKPIEVKTVMSAIYDTLAR